MTEYQFTEAGELVVRGRRGVDARPLVDSVVGEVEGERDDGPDGRRDRAETAGVAAHHPVVGAVARQRAGRGPSVFVALRRRGQLRDDESSQNYRQYRQPLDVTRRPQSSWCHRCDAGRTRRPVTELSSSRLVCTLDKYTTTRCTFSLSGPFMAKERSLMVSWGLDPRATTRACEWSVSSVLRSIYVIPAPAPAPMFLRRPLTAPQTRRPNTPPMTFSQIR